MQAQLELALTRPEEEQCNAIYTSFPSKQVVFADVITVVVAALLKHGFVVVQDYSSLDNQNQNLACLVCYPCQV